MEFPICISINLWCVFVLQNPTYVVSALLLPGHVGEAWKPIRKLCTFGSKGLSSHSEEIRDTFAAEIRVAVGDITFVH
jgi:hypothetical protein